MKVSLSVNRIRLLIISFFSLATLIASGSFINESIYGNKLIIFTMYLIVILAVVLIWKLSFYERGVPIYDIGAISISITILYSFYPLLSFASEGFGWSVVSDYRLNSLKLTSEDLANFVLQHHVVYIVGLILGYLFIRNRKSSKDILQRIKIIRRNDIYSLFSSYILVTIILIICGYFYSDSHFARQVAHNVSSFKFIIELAMIYVAVINWKRRLWRLFFVAFLFYLASILLLKLSGRTYPFIMFIACLMLYHRYVKEFTFKGALLLFLFLMAFFIFWGVVKVGALSSTAEYGYLAQTNEFTSLLGTSYDLFYRRYVIETLPDIPFQLFFNDFILLIPSQLLPFYKWSTSQWYLEVIGHRNEGVGFMFGVISQGVIGEGSLELILRGLFTGVFLGSIYNWHVNNSCSIWHAVSYSFITLRSYYIFRAGTGYLFYDIVYQLIPTIVLCLLLRHFFNSFPKTIKREIL
jgi:hypothetical protein